MSTTHDNENSINTYAFEQIVSKVKPHRQNAQILIQESSGECTIENAIEILKNNLSISIKYNILKRDSPKILHVLLASEEMRNAIEKLIEAGYDKFHGIDRRKKY
jgi:hypothetical protein